jgi:hypothetical protein
MDTTHFKLHTIKGRIVASGSSQNFTCELVLVHERRGSMMIAVVSFGALKRETAVVYPVDGVVVNPNQYCIDTCEFYEAFRADVWSDLYKDDKRAI